MRVLFKNGTVVSGKGTRRADVLVDGEKIQRVARGIHVDDAQVVDAAGMLLMRQEYALLLAALIALIDALPVFGTGTVLVPWAAVECLLGNVPKGAALLALFAVISVVRSVLEPKLVAPQAGLPPLASLAAMYVGFCAMGVAGMVLSPVLLLLVKQLHDGGYIRLWR